MCVGTSVFLILSQQSFASQVHKHLILFHWQQQTPSGSSRNWHWPVINHFNTKHTHTKRSTDLPLRFSLWKCKRGVGEGWIIIQTLNSHVVVVQDRPADAAQGGTEGGTIPQAQICKANEWNHWSPHSHPTWGMSFQYKFHSHLCSLVRNNGLESNLRREFDHKPQRKLFDIHNLWLFYCLWILFF